MIHSIGFQPFAVQELSPEGLRKSSLDPFLSRSNYFDGRLLKAADLTRDQQYLDERLLQTGRVLGSGVVKGLRAELSVSQKITVSPGLAITASGRVLESVNSLNIDLTERAAIAVINQPPLRYFNRGLYALILQYTEKGVGIAETYPADIGQPIEPRINSYEEGVELALVPLRENYPSGSELSTRAALAGKLLPQLQALPEIPDDAVALALLAIDNNIGQWLDRSLLFRPAGIHLQSNAVQQLLAAHYEELLADVLNARNWSSLQAAFGAGQFFQWLPPVGSLPKQAVDPEAALQRFFPESFKVSIVPVRKEDLPVLEAEAMLEQPIDLSQDKNVEIMILAPLADADFNFYARRLEAPTATPAEEPFALSSRLLPSLLPLTLSVRPLRRPAIDTGQPNYWRNVWDRVGEGQLRYLRRPARIAENHISTVVLARGFQLPDALPPDTSELEQLNQRLLQAEQARDSFQAQLQTSRQQLKSLQQDYAKLKSDYEALLNSGGQTGGGLSAQVEARGLRDKTTLEMARKYLDNVGNQPKLQDATGRVLALLDSVYDRAFWPSLLQSLEAGLLEKLLLNLLETLQAGKPAHEFMINAGPDFGLKDDSLQLWKRAGDFVGG
ncbi:hypothetical protein [Methylomonas methanica]|uniref:Uncharacterized protein n=1 Tax=Methylomonas methanica (strain DSM 25384 / MC09) TaxID=857087 RepID=F9ZW21_METMM|nr:hypothetical protein [Methylomonas methanica]AEG00825.1 hypothetical protein Metme_2427 [Methylomonas methanica MC09]